MLRAVRPLGGQTDGTDDAVVGILQPDPRINIVFGDGMVLSKQIASVKEIVDCSDIVLLEKPVSQVTAQNGSQVINIVGVANPNEGKLLVEMS